MRHTEESKRRIGAASKARNSAAIALRARWEDRQLICSVVGCSKVHEAKGFCNMHYARFKKSGEAGQAERFHDGNGTIDANGYMIVRRAGEHVTIAEGVLGRKLPAGSIVHHVNENKTDNRKGNLVICPSRGYHSLIHARMRALDACGNANWMLCPFCGKYDDPANMYVYPNRRAAKHTECFNRYRIERNAAR